MFSCFPAAYQTDFSVTNRLLPPYNSNSASNLQTNVPSVTIAYRNGGGGGGGGPYHQQPQQNQHSSVSSLPSWQSLLPNDQGGLPTRSYQCSAGANWRNGVPNTSLPQPCSVVQGPMYPSVGYNPSTSYLPTIHDPVPDSSTGGSSQFGDKTGKENSLNNGGGLTNGERSGVWIYVSSSLCLFFLSLFFCCNQASLLGSFESVLVC